AGAGLRGEEGGGLSARTGWGPVHGMYRLTWREGGEEREPHAALRHEAAVRWPQVGLSLYSEWERPLAFSSGSPGGRTAADPDPPAFQQDRRLPVRGASIAPAGSRAAVELRP